ncbi:hypothetical protein VB005_09293 [Metarhizium brunneum]
MNLDLTFDVTTPENYLVPTNVNRPPARQHGGISTPSRRAERWVPRYTSTWREKLPSEQAAEGLLQVLTMSFVDNNTRSTWDFRCLGGASEKYLPLGAEPNRRAYFVLAFLWVCEVTKQFGRVPLSAVNQVQRSFLRV